MKLYAAVFLVLCVLLCLFSACNTARPTADSTSLPGSMPQQQNSTQREEVDVAQENDAGNYANAVYYEVKYGQPGLLYSAPDPNAAVIEENLGDFYVLEEKDGWAYGCWGNWLGWMSTEELESGLSIMTVPLPEFLTAEQKIQFLRATCMFNAYICSNQALRINVISGDYPENRIQNDMGWYYSCDTVFNTYFEFNAVLHDLFTESFLNSRHKSYIESAGKLYIVEADRGRWLTAVEGYTLEEQTAERIAFQTNFIYKTSVGEHRCSLPVVMVKTDEGWRFDDFTSGEDDLRWMEAMGEDFDPWEGRD